MSCRTAALAFMVLLLAGCTAQIGRTADVKRAPVRASTEAEAGKVSEALMPLLGALGYRIEQTSVGARLPRGCRIGLVVIQSAAINAGAAPGRTEPCVSFTLAITEGALARLPVAQLRAILAHELGHVHLDHFTSRRERREAGSVPLLGRAFDRDEEAAADRFAVALLKRLEPQVPGACIALTFVFEMLAERPGWGVEWLSSHPSPANRAAAVQAACNERPAAEGELHRLAAGGRPSGVRSGRRYWQQRAEQDRQREQAWERETQEHWRQDRERARRWQEEWRQRREPDRGRPENQ